MKYSIEQLVSPAISALNAYHVPSSQGFVKLDAMENPYSWPEEMKAACMQALSSINVARYPSADCPELIEQLRDVFSVPEESAVLLGNGSDEIIQMLVMLLNKQFGSVLSVEPSFVMYRVICECVGIPYYGVSLNEDFSLNIDLFLKEIEDKKPALIFLAVPNNPTGNCFKKDDIRKIMDVAPGLVVIDEAYSAFTESNYLPFLTEYPHLMVMRTLSKIGLAGLRLGWIAGSKPLISQLNKVRLPYNINAYTQQAACFALDHFSILLKQTQQIKVSRNILFSALTSLNSNVLTVFPSEANFLLVRTNKYDATVIFNALKQHKILIKCLQGAHPLLSNCLRITVGTEEQNQKLIEALSTIFFGINLYPK